MTPMRTSSLKHIDARTPKPSKENLSQPRSRSASPRKALQEINSNTTIQPSDLVSQDSQEDLIEHSKRMFRSLQIENEKLKQRIESLEYSKAQVDATYREKIQSLQKDLEKMAEEKHKLENMLQESKKQTSNALIISPRKMDMEHGVDVEIERLSEELAWHAKLHLFAEKERMRLMDLLEFAGHEGKFMVRQFHGLREKMSKVSLMSMESEGKCLI
jgi:predicted  nucleic acid-binding Zn-ribbon protein